MTIEKGAHVPFVRDPYNYDRDKASELSGLLCLEDSLTQQQFLEETDINTIVDRFGITGQLPENPQPPQYADFEGIFDFQAAQNAVIAADRAFMTFPAKVRNRFQNDPQQMLEFVSNKENRAEAEALGLLKPAPPAPSPPPPEPPKTSAST